jgi:hypothetical protein
MSRITLADVDKKIDLLLQKSEYITIEQKRVADELTHHTEQDQTRFDHLSSTHQVLLTEIALLKQNTSSSRLFANRAWSIATGIITTACGAAFAFWWK